MIIIAQIKLGKVFGIQIGIHFSWLIIALFIVICLSGYFAENHPSWSSLTVWSLAVFTAVLFFASIVLHEFSHAAVASSKNLPVRSITLFALGGVAEIDKESPDAKTELGNNFA